MSKCEGCDLYTNGYCTKFRQNGKAESSTREWLDECGEFIPEYRMCRKSSIFGNVYVGITLDDGEILHISGEIERIKNYGTFIGLVDEKGETE